MTGAATCGNCGAGVPVADVVCPECAFPVPRVAVPARALPAGDGRGGRPGPGQPGHPGHPGPPGHPGGPAEPEVTRAEAVPPHAPACVCDHRDSPPGAVLCPACGEPVADLPGAPVRPAGGAGRVVLAFPWGEHTLVPGDEVDVGREVGPFERFLEPFLTVGRRHASLRFTERGVLLVRDHGSLNGTFVNGARCASTGAVEVPAGSELRFSSAVRVLVRFEP